ncbi:protein IMPAIRED IN BABA-INDUCED STERILITY 1-like [Lolium rigidum]|uniref:protein IMPAIRED IN BABA-INDUCED STERILITY 1-like n=1 Tax=Lolium rigidum TaxID=89674 RepID=UPI001F5DE80B|nr:protein IMPAIRED IN BABA-INDUCED STERILITY 1-like [Lolium rigidum]
MGCAVSKGAAQGSPGYDVSSASGYEAVSRSASASASIWSRPVRLEALDLGGDGEEQEGVPGNIIVAGAGTARLGNLHRYIECEQAAAGWPAWLSAVAAEAVQGWVPLKSENFEKLEKIGQGTYSSVFRARSLETGRVVALKKVRFDSLEPESVRFMAREIVVLRRLQGHPNVVGLHGLITSRSSPSIYLVFEYMEHDLAGLASSSAADSSFSQPQIKCYMRQLLAGLEHCHARGVMHRDIKCANLLVSADGQLKIADFGLANLFSSSPQQPPLTSRVVTLWYRPPELLLGATAYDPTVDLWSAGCVFAELHARRPVLQGRTEVEQIHKIFKLCGSPPDAYWRRLGNVSSSSSVFRPQVPYESRLGETFGSAMPDAALRLLSTLLSVEPAARGTASSALASNYFAHASEPPSAMIPPRCAAPNREMDAKLRDEESRRRRNETAKRLSRAHRSMQDTSSSQRHHGHVHAEESLPLEVEPVVAASKRHDDDARPTPAPCARQEEDAPARLADHVALSAGPVQLAASTGFAWAKKPRVPDAAATKRSSSRRTNNTDGGDAASTGATTTTTAPYEVEKQEMIKQWAQVAEAFGSSQPYNSSRSIREPLDGKQLKTSKKNKGKKMKRVDYSGPLLSRVDDLLHLQSHEQQIRRAGRRSWFHKGSKREQQQH